MIELHDLCFDEPNDSASDSICLSSVACRSPVPLSSNSVRYDPSSIKTLLKEQPEKYILVDNRKSNPSKPSACWKRFALPAMKDENDRTVVIKNFASCRSCYTTYTYTYGSTKSLNSHKCPKDLASTPCRSSSRYSRHQHSCV
jgi:hypothetical protein